MLKFSEMNFPDSLNKGIQALNFETPTPIQIQAIPVAMAGRDILGSAQTGTGKTAAFALPMIAQMINSEARQGLIICPTRELASQVEKNIFQMLRYVEGMKTALLIGGDSVDKQIKQLNRRPKIIVGTPGRIFFHTQRQHFDVRKTDYLVLDETDRMLDMGFMGQIDDIVDQIPSERQTLLFSATLPKEIIKFTDKYLDNPERISAGGDSKPAENVTQHILQVKQADKFQELEKQLDERTGTIIVFVKTKRSADTISARLRRDNHSVEAFHGDLRHRARERVLKDFHAKRHRILIATDIAARGLDIPHIEHVINFDMPQCPEDYIHRIGRTARAGAKGESVCLIAPSDKGNWYAIQRLLDPNAKHEPLAGGHDRGGRSGGDRRGGGQGGRSNGRSSGGRGGDRGGGFGGERRGGGSRPEGDRPSRRFNDRDGSRGDDRRDSRGGRSDDRPQRSDDRPQRSSDSRGGFGSRDRDGGRDSRPNSRPAPGRRPDDRRDSRSDDRRSDDRRDSRPDGRRDNRGGRPDDRPQRSSDSRGGFGAPRGRDDRRSNDRSSDSSERTERGDRNQAPKDRFNAKKSFIKKSDGGGDFKKRPSHGSKGGEKSKPSRRFFD